MPRGTEERVQSFGRMVQSLYQVYLAVRFFSTMFIYVVRYEFYPVSLGLYLKRLVEFDVTTHTRIQSRNGHGG